MSSPLPMITSCATDNQKGILLTMGIIIVVDCRENTISRGIDNML